MANILTVENLTKKFAGLTAVNNLSFTMKERTIHSLIGPNGSGKSTTINMCTGAFPMTSGTIKFGDEVISGLVLHQIASKNIGRTFQNLKLFGSMTVKENLMVGMQAQMTDNILKFLVNPKAARTEEKRAEERALEVLDYIGMYKYRDETVKNLAYGQQKLTELGRSIMTSPKLLFLDEPAAGLNPSERVDFVKILLKVFDDGVDLFLIEHNMDVVMNISNYITVINFGSKIAEGTPKEIQNNDEVIAAYLGSQFKKK
ncbi:ABC transporter ATP-binding protein [Clostridium sp. Marseille-P299]|uniref:ABC transporter ATP-binding protein n=1 Tax=Clostridium sp. Marseille-P299 TaxID=1805477 RepID=UPI00082DA83F|nr:ABC transporter ATP-binding protein [Clostridium sp. Marseille-P299]